MIIVHAVEPDILNATYSGNETTEGQTTTFTCVANGFPPPEIVWLLNTSLIVIVLSPRHSVSVDEVSSSNRDYIPAVRSKLAVAMVRLRDTGDYTCRVGLDRGRPDFSDVLDLLVESGTYICIPHTHD